MSYREEYEKAHGKIPERHELHHIVPRHAGGTDNVNNLMLVTPEEHAIMHLNRYLEFGDFRDLCAYHMIGYNYTEAHRISSSAGGKKGGSVVYERRIGIFRCEEERRQWASAAGKIGGKIQKIKKLGIHGLDKETRLVNSKKGNRACKEKGVGFYNSKTQSALGKRGGPKNKGFVWINDGENNVKYTPKMQKEKSLGDFLKENKQYKKGRLLNKDVIDRFKYINKGSKYYNDGITSKKYTTKMQEVKSFEKFLEENPQYKKGMAAKNKRRKNNA